MVRKHVSLLCGQIKPSNSDILLRWASFGLHKAKNLESKRENGVKLLYDARFVPNADVLTVAAAYPCSTNHSDYAAKIRQLAPSSFCSALQRLCGVRFN